MCGINGITLPNQVDRVNKMLDVTARRGPDGRDVYTNKHITFGHNLLAIFDKPENSKQPYVDGDFVMVFNGAIYNYKELDEWNCRTNTDTEVLAKGLQKYGVKFLERCEGMWAVAWYKDGVTTICRDHFGVKPLFYRKTNDGLIFSSSIHALENKNNKLDIYAFSLYNAFGYVPGYLTLLEGCFKLCPGEFIVYSKSETYSGNLWKSKKFGKSSFDVKEFQSKLGSAIAKSHVGIRQRGVFLSGGLDSTSVAHYLNERNTFTNRYETSNELANDDANVAYKMAEQYGYNHTEVLITPENFYNNISESIQVLELPVFNKSTPAYYFMNKVMRKKGTIVTYSGDGGDEMYTGYSIHGSYGKVEDPIEDHFVTCAWKPGKGMTMSNEGFYLTKDSYVSYMNNWFPREVFGDDHKNNCLFVEMLTRVSEDFLTRNDKFGAHFGMEGRFPLLNQSYYDYIMSIPSDVKMMNLNPKSFQPGEYKFLAREGLKGVLPEFVINKGKSGWTIPDAEWRKEEKKFMNKMFNVVRQPLGNKLDGLINWQKTNGPKTFYAAVFLKHWFARYDVTI